MGQVLLPCKAIFCRQIGSAASSLSVNPNLGIWKRMPKKMKILLNSWKAPMVTQKQYGGGCECMFIRLPCDIKILNIADAAHVGYMLQMNNSMAAKREEIVEQTSGEEGQMQVQFREVNPFDLWVSLCPIFPAHCRM